MSTGVDTKIPAWCELLRSHQAGTIFVRAYRPSVIVYRVICLLATLLFDISKLCFIFLAIICKITTFLGQSPHFEIFLLGICLFFYISSARSPPCGFLLNLYVIWANAFEEIFILSYHNQFHASTIHSCKLHFGN